MKNRSSIYLFALSICLLSCGKKKDKCDTLPALTPFTFRVINGDGDDLLNASTAGYLGIPKVQTLGMNSIDCQIEIREISGKCYAVAMNLATKRTGKQLDNTNISISYPNTGRLDTASISYQAAACDMAQMDSLKLKDIGYSTINDGYLPTYILKY